MHHHHHHFDPNMTTSEICLLCVGIAQTFILTWYAIETWKLRKSASQQTETIGKQFVENGRQNELMSAQLATMQKSLEMAISKEERDADIHIFWEDGNTDHQTYRTAKGTNYGGDVQLLEVRSTVNPSHAEFPSKICTNRQSFGFYLGGNTTHVVHFGIRYLTKLKKVREQVFVMKPSAVVPLEELGVAYNTLNVTIPMFLPKEVGTEEPD
jgi:hypothetical protein